MFLQHLHRQPFWTDSVPLARKNTIIITLFEHMPTYASRFAIARCAKAPMIETGNAFDPLAAATRTRMSQPPNPR
jgi:hypothetical protein